jgi:hypothetical protein
MCARRTIQSNMNAPRTIQSNMDELTRELNEVILQGDRILGLVPVSPVPVSPFAELDVDTIINIWRCLVLDPDSGEALSNAFLANRALNQAGAELVDSGLWPEFRVAPIAAWLRTILEADQVPRTEACPFMCVPASFCSAHNLEINRSEFDYRKDRHGSRRKAEALREMRASLQTEFVVRLSEEGNRSKYCELYLIAACMVYVLGFVELHYETNDNAFWTVSYEWEIAGHEANIFGRFWKNVVKNTYAHCFEGRDTPECRRLRDITMGRIISKLVSQDSRFDKFASLQKNLQQRYVWEKKISNL